jgi:hemoglobin-like flavoprotein
MHPQERQHVRATWSALAADPDRLIGPFYERLFTLDPSLRLLTLGGDPMAYGRTFIHTISVAVANLERREGIVAHLHGEERHTAEYAALGDGGVVGAALVWAVERALGPSAWTMPVRGAWHRCAALLARSQRPPVVPAARVA